MAGSDRWMAVALAGALAVGVTASARGADAPAAPVVDEAAFVAALDTARGILASGRGGDGLRLLERVLEEHKGRDYVRAKRLDLEDLVHRLAFRAEVPPPDPQTVVKGKLKKFVSRTGELEIRYERGKPHDFEPHGERLLFPARFSGPYTITIKGDAYPDSASAIPYADVGHEENPKTHKVQAWRIVFGVAPFADAPGRKAHMPAKILYLDGTEQKTILEKQSPAVSGKPWRVEVGLTGTRVTASVNGTPVGGANKPAGVWGRALVHAVNWSEIVVSGRVEPSWIQGKLDEIVDGKRGAFEKTYDVRKYLPAWLLEGPPLAAASPKPAGPSAKPAAPSGKPAAGSAPTAGAPSDFEGEKKSIERLLERFEFDAALAAARALEAKGAPASLAAVLAARALLGLDEPKKAIEEADRAIAADVEAVDAYLWKGVALLQTGNEDDLVATLRAGLARPTATQEAYERGGLLLLRAGRLDEARATSEGASRKGLRSPGLDTLGRLVVRAQNGPDWPRSYQHKTGNYHVVSDIDDTTCRKAAEVLEEALANFRRTVRPIEEGPARRLYKVYLFSGQAGFLRYCADLSALHGPVSERVAGMYSPVLKQLVIWNLPEREEMLETIRHEGFHQYLDRLLPDPPVWFNEGLAEYYEEAERAGGTLRTGKPCHDHLKVLAGKPLVPSKDFLHIRPDEFYRGGSASYAQAWLLVHMLRHGDLKHRERYQALLTRLETASALEAVDAVFPEADLAALDEALQNHLDGLRAGK
ncbi:MAG TPA: hypothetical protein VND21_06095 [Planctomycetota bacterium]|nr:hypothetical protein [Planctomycetota bacterium]